MNQKHKKYLQLFIVITWFLAFLFVYGRMGALQLDSITVEQACVSGAVGIVYMAIAVITCKILGEEE